jgi:ADP-glucose pyrophosphorylase
MHSTFPLSSRLYRWHLLRVVAPACVSQNSSVGAYTSRGFVEVLAASQSNVRKEWFQGTADAVRQYMWLFEEAMRDGVQDFLILSGEQL